MSIFRRQITPISPRLDQFGMLAQAAPALSENLGFASAGVASICFRAIEDRPFRTAEYDAFDLLKPHGAETVPEDSYGFSWLVARRQPAEFGSLITDLNTAAAIFSRNGFGAQLLCSLAMFEDRGERQLALVYLFKQGTFYPFSPRRDNVRDNRLETPRKGCPRWNTANGG